MRIALFLIVQPLHCRGIWGKNSEMNSVTVMVARISGTEDIDLPSYETEQAAGMDIRAAVSETVVLLSGERAAITTGLCIALPVGFEAQIRPRSGLALKNGIALVNAPGTIDADYRGEIKVILINHGSEPFAVERGMRIAQMVIAPVQQAQWAIVETLETTQRGSGGFGHTGAI